MKTKIYTAKKLLEMEIKEIPSLLEPILPKVGLAAVTGSSDVGKSSFLRNLSMSIVTGQKQFLGFDLKPKHKSVIYVATEDDVTATAATLFRAYGNQKPFDQFEGVRFLFETGNLLSNLAKELKSKPADCVIIDTYSDIFDGQMNLANEVRTFLTKYKELADKFECLIIFLHHTGKRTEQNVPSKDNTLGSQGFEAKMRVLVEIRKDYNSPEKRHLCILKGNYLPEEYKNKSFVLQFDENQTFSSLNDRVSFANLMAPTSDDIKNGRKKEAIELAIQLKADGKTHQTIAEEVTKSGYKVSKSTISDWTRNNSNPQTIEIQPSETSKESSPNSEDIGLDESTPDDLDEDSDHEDDRPDEPLS